MTRLAAILAALLAVIGCAGRPSAARAQDYPSRPITLVAPFAPGGSIDIVARIAAAGLQARLGQPVVVENRAGGNGVAGTRDVVKAAADGYTLLLGSVGGQVIPAAMQSDYPFEPLRDFTPVGMLAEWDAVIAARRDFPADTLPQLIAAARARPGKLTYGSTGYASFTHLIAEVLMQRAGITMQHVPYKSGANSLTDLLAGAIDVVFTSTAVAVSQRGNKDLKMLAIATRQRFAMLPDVPTVAEAGIAGVDQTTWICILGPPGLPPAVKARVGNAIRDTVHDPAVQQRLRAIGFEPAAIDPAGFAPFYRDEVRRWAEFIHARGLRAGP